MAENFELNVSSKEIEIGDENGIENVPEKLKDTEKPQVVTSTTIKRSFDLYRS